VFFIDFRSFQEHCDASPYRQIGKQVSLARVLAGRQATATGDGQKLPEKEKRPFFCRR
jgi:hypothetical protein